MTNGDRIRGMCDGDFADWFVKIVQNCRRCPAFSTCDFNAVELDEKEEDPFNYCIAGFEKWLKDECKRKGREWLSQEREEKPREHVGILPVPCTKVNETTVKDWFQKINEELDEFKEGLSLSDEPEELIFSEWAKDRYAEEAADTITAITSMLEAMGIDERMRQEAQMRVNKRNAERGRL